MPTPILVGVAAVQQRLDTPNAGHEPVGLMIEACRRAAEDAGSGELLTRAKRIAVPQGLWSYSDPARLVADAIGADSATSVYAEIGITQQSLFADACRHIQSGEADVAIVTGAEAKYRQLRASIAGEQASETEQTTPPDVHLKPADEMWSSVEEAAIGHMMPVNSYALMESAIRHDRGMSVDQHRDWLAQRYARFNEVAVNNDAAWDREPKTAEQIRNVGEGNRMLAFPYTKLMNTQWNVDQGAALIFCTEELATELGIAREKWIYPLASTESNVMLNVSERPKIQDSDGAIYAAKAVLELSGKAVDDLDFIDLYNCFPAPVSIYQSALGIPDDRDLTVTGGMSFAGGPLNNYVLQSTVRLAQLLRDKPGSAGLNSSVSGLLTKQAFGIWSTEPSEKGFQFADVSDKVSAECEVKTVVPPSEGKATIAAHTVIYNKAEMSRAVAVLDLPDGKRTVAKSLDQKVMERLVEQDCIGVEVSILADGDFEF